MEFDLDERVAKARQNFLSGYNCTQSVVMAYHDLLNIDPTLALTISAPFGGGMGRLREVCGAASGMFIIAGFIIPVTLPATTSAGQEAKKQNYALVQALAKEYQEVNGGGSIVCRELLGLDHKKDAPTPSERTQEYYQKRPCAELVAIAARIVGKRLLEMK